MGFLTVAYRGLLVVGVAKGVVYTVELFEGEAASAKPDEADPLTVSKVLRCSGFEAWWGGWDPNPIEPTESGGSKSLCIVTPPIFSSEGVGWRPWE